MNQNRSVEERVGHRDSQSPATDKGSDFEIDYLLQSARKLVDNNEFVLATNIYRKVVAMDVSNPEAFRGLGICLEKKENFEKARQCFEQWARLTQSPEAYSRLSFVCLKLKDDRGAIQYLERALQSQPRTDDDRFELLNHLGNAHLRQGQLDLAQKRYHEALALRPRSDRTHVNLATLCFQRGDLDGALKSYREALQLNPQSTRALCGLGLIAQEQRQWKDAILCFTKALDVEWDNLVAVHGLIRTGQQLQEFSIIEKYLKRYLTNYPSNVAIIYCLAGNYFHQKKWRQCHEEIQKIELLEPFHEPTQELKGLLLQAEQVTTKGEGQ